MDERTRRTDDEVAPNLRRTTPEPHVKSRTYSKLRIGVGLIVAIGLVLGAYQIARWVRAPQPSSGRFPQGGLQSVGAATVALNNVPVVVNALGTVTPIATVTVQTQINGQLTEVDFTEGQIVQKGDFLAQIDPRPYEILKAQYEGQLAHDQGLLSQAQMDLKRYQTLAEQNSIARQQAEDQVFIVQQYAGLGEARPGSGRRADAEHRLLPHRFAGHRPYRSSPDRSGKLRADRQRDRHRRRHPAAADHGDLSRFPRTICRKSCRS